jgi:hypothetical protein
MLVSAQLVLLARPIPAQDSIRTFTITDSIAPDCNLPGWRSGVTHTPTCPLTFVDGVLLDKAHPPTCVFAPGEIVGISRLNKRLGEHLFGQDGSHGVLIITTKHPEARHCRALASSSEWPFTMGLGLPDEQPLWVINGIVLDSLPPDCSLRFESDKLDILSVSIFEGACVGRDLR